MTDCDDLIEEDEPIRLEVLPYDFTVCKVADYTKVNLEDDFCFTLKRIAKSHWCAGQPKCQTMQPNERTDGERFELPLLWIFHSWVF